MPMLNRVNFAHATEGVFQQALASFRRNGVVYETVYGFDARSHHTTVLGVSAPPESTARLDAVVVPSPLRDHVKQVAPVLQAHQAVAAIHTAEAWMVHGSGSTVGEALAKLGASPVSEHPERLEIISTVGFFPREYLTAQHIALIRRYPDGTTALEVLPDPAGYGVPLTAQAWLANVLPQPPHPTAPTDGAARR